MTRLACFMLVLLPAFSIVSSQPNKSLPSYEAVDINRTGHDELIVGDRNAPHTIYVYVRLDCTYCLQFHETILPKIAGKFIETGSIKLVYRILLTSNSPIGEDVISTEILACSQMENKLESMANVVFRNRGFDPWKNFKSWRQEAGIVNEERFDHCLSFHISRPGVIESQYRFARHNIRVTPTLYINDLKLEGLQPYSIYEKAIFRQLQRTTIAG